MNIIELSLDHIEFYCPVTGMKIMGEDHALTPSPAMVFCFINESGEFEYAKDWIVQEFEKCLNEVDEDEFLRESMAFELLLKNESRKIDDLVCFSLCYKPVPMAPEWEYHICIDMNYTAVE